MRARRDRRVPESGYGAEGAEAEEGVPDDDDADKEKEPGTRTHVLLRVLFRVLLFRVLLAALLACLW